MSTEQQIGLFDLIDHIKRELSQAHSDKLPYFAVGSVAVEISFTAVRGADGKLDLHVVSVGGDISDEKVQRITVTLEPLVTVEELRKELTPRQRADLGKVLMRGEEE